MSAFFTMLPSLACAVTAGVLAYRKADGWGWFLFAALLLASSIKVSAS